MRLSLRDSARITSTIFPIANEPRDWTEPACLILTGIGVSYFAIHFAVAAARGLFS